MLFQTGQQHLYYLSIFRQRTFTQKIYPVLLMLKRSKRQKIILIYSNVFRIFQESALLVSE